MAMAEVAEEELTCATWNAFRQLAGLVTKSELTFWLESVGGSSNPDPHSVSVMVSKALNRPPWEPGDRGPRIVETQIRRRVFHELVALGFIVPGDPVSHFTWGAERGAFTFTQRGLQYFKAGIALDTEPDALAAKLLDLHRRFPDTVSVSQLTLLREARHCWRQACYRAAMILTGLACEDAALALVDALDAYPAKAATGPTLADWKGIAPGGMFSQRWGAAVRVIRRLRDGLRAAGKAQDWWKLLDPQPEWLLPLGEAVRVARNESAHNSDRDYGLSDVTLLLAALPTQLEVIAELRSFLGTGAPGLSWPTV